MYINIVFLPLIGSFLSGLFGRYLGPYGAGIVTTSCVASSLFISFFAFYEVGFCGSPCYVTLLTCCNANCCHLYFKFSSLVFNRIYVT